MGADGELLRRRRKELALLLVIALRAPRSVRREELLTLFWGERGEERARHSLRQALLHLRRACGDAILEITPETLRIANGELAVDARAFAGAAAAGHARDAIDLWAGEFMPGCEDVGGEELRVWIEGERARLGRLLHACYRELVAELASAADARELLHYAERWSGQYPLDEDASLRHIDALSRLGMRGEATAARDAFVERVRADLDEVPGPEWLAATTAFVERASRAPVGIAAPTSAAATADVAPVKDASFLRATWRRYAAAVTVLTVAGATWWTMKDRASAPNAVLMVGRIETPGLPDSVADIRTLLAMHLGRTAGLSVVDPARVELVRSQLDSRGDTSSDVRRVARAAGADEIIEGVVARDSGRSLRLELRRMDLKGGVTRATFAVNGTDLYELVAAAGNRIAGDFGATLPDHPVRTSSLTAMRFYEEGLRAHYRGEENVASNYLTAALREDSTLAMAAYHLAGVANAPNPTGLLRQARRMSRDGPDRERLVIEARWLSARDDARQLAVAETLAIRYPAEPGAHLAYGRALVRAGRFLEAIPHYRQVVHLDSLGLRGVQAHCTACDGYRGLLDAYRFADSMGATERVSVEWVARQPHSPWAWASVATVRKVQGRFAESIAASDSAARFDITNQRVVVGLMDLWLRMGDFASADRYWSGLLSATTERARGEALSAAISSLRLQGRLTEALAAAVQSRRTNVQQGNPLRDAFEHATVLCDMGRHRECAALFDSISAPNPEDSQARQSRDRAWYLTHAATAAAAMRDTNGLRRLEDTIRVRGAQSGFRRDQLLHHYVHGLRLRLQGQHAAAAESFRRSLYSPVEGNTRASVELARTLLELGRADEATRVLRSAHWGPIGASGQYVNRTELELLFARAFEASNRPDSAVAHYAWTMRAWRSADASFTPQKQDVARRIAALARAPERTR